MANLSFTMIDLRQRVKRCTASGDGYVGCCPAHDDGKPSFSFQIKGERVVFHCAAGCSPDAIVGALGMEWPDFFADGVEGRKRQHHQRPDLPRPTPKIEPPPPDYEPLLRAARALPDHRRKMVDLARELGALPESLQAYADAADAVGAVWLTKAPTLLPLLPHRGRGWKQCWAIPEKDADGRVIGLTRRYAGGKKRAMPGGKRGLTYSLSALAGTGPVCIPEGASDVIALTACDVRAIGRPSNTGGAAMLAALLSEVDASVIVLGENDHKADGRCPGREGMEKIGAALVRALPSHVVQTAMPPTPAKDAREWVAGRSGVSVGVMFWVALTLSVASCPHDSINSDVEKNCAPPPPDPLADLPDPPPAVACLRGGSSLLHHVDDPDRHRSCRHACDSWRCDVCRRRNAHQWVTHLADCLADAEREGCTLHVGEATRDRLDGCLGKAIRRQDADWCALELLPGVLLVIAAIPAGGKPPAGLDPIRHHDACLKMVAWAKEVRTGPEPFSKRNKNMRPVRTSRGWQLNRPEPLGDWKVVCPIDSQSPDPVADVVRQLGGRITCDVASVGEERGSPSSLIWKIEWRADPDTATRITEALKQLDERPAPQQQKQRRPEDDNPFLPPGG